MKWWKMQPTFALVVQQQLDSSVLKLRKAIQDPRLQGKAIFAGQCFEFRIEPEQQRLWSPHLSIQVTEVPEGAEVFGRFSPRPEIWGMFMVVYMIAAICAFGASIYGYVQWFMGQTPWAFVVVPAGILLIVALHLLSLVGQSLSTDQMELLRGRYDLAHAIAFETAAEEGETAGSTEFSTVAGCG